MVIVVGGMIGLGKTSVSEMIAQELNSEVFYESVDDNPILPLFYSSSEEEIQSKRYPFLLQIFFLNKRFKSIKVALTDKNNVLDRSIYEDYYFCMKNVELGRISELEFNLYKELLDNMMEELEELPKKAPDLMVYLKGSFETVLSRIKKRGREYELDKQLEEYYYHLWKDYDEFIKNHYNASEVIVIDMDKFDIVNNIEDRQSVMSQIKKFLNIKEN